MKHDEMHHTPGCAEGIISGDGCNCGGMYVTVRGSGRANLDVITANGFAAPSWDNFPAKLMLVWTEVTEAERAVANDARGEEARQDVDPLEEELADIAIRLTGLLFGLFGDSWSTRGARGFFHHAFQPIECLLRPIRDSLTDAAEAWRREKQTDVMIALEIALAKTEAVALVTGIDLVAEMEAKREKNAKRPSKHGMVRSDG